MSITHFSDIIFTSNLYPAPSCTSIKATTCFGNEVALHVPLSGSLRIHLWQGQLARASKGVVKHISI